VWRWKNGIFERVEPGRTKGKPPFWEDEGGHTPLLKSDKVYPVKKVGSYVGSTDCGLREH